MNVFLSNDIKNYPDSILTEKSIKIINIDDHFVVLSRQLQKKIRENNLDSLSAIQLGFPVAMIGVDTGEKNPLIMINPQVLELHNEYSSMEEHCPSLNGITVKITRPKRILVEYMDLEGNTIKMQPNDEISRRILHEMDHIEGKLIIDRVETEEERESIIQRYIKNTQLIVPSSNNS